MLGDSISLTLPDWSISPSGECRLLDFSVFLGLSLKLPCGPAGLGLVLLLPLLPGTKATGTSAYFTVHGVRSFASCFPYTVASWNIRTWYLFKNPVYFCILKLNKTPLWITLHNELPVSTSLYCKSRISCLHTPQASDLPRKLLHNVLRQHPLLLLCPSRFLGTLSFL